MITTRTLLISAIEEDTEADARLLWAIADPARLRILRLLKAQEEALCVFEIAERVGLEQPTISHHLRLLLEARLIVRRGYHTYNYHFINNERLVHAQQIIADLMA